MCIRDSNNAGAGPEAGAVHHRNRPHFHEAVAAVKESDVSHRIIEHFTPYGGIAYEGYIWAPGPLR
eukprot:5326935-Pyramimonas_sp.AAC.1